MREYNIEKECFNCESTFTVLSENNEVEYCPFCGAELEDEHYGVSDDYDDNDEPTHNHD